MKLVLLLACLFASAYGEFPPQIEEKIIEVLALLAKECIEKVGATEEDVALMREDQLPKSRSGKCFLACLNKELGFQDNNGKVDEKSAMAQIQRIKAFDEDMYIKMKQLAETCFTKAHEVEDECETASNMMTCASEESEKLGLKSLHFL